MRCNYPSRVPGENKFLYKNKSNKYMRRVLHSSNVNLNNLKSALVRRKIRVIHEKTTEKPRSEFLLLVSAVRYFSSNSIGMSLSKFRSRSNLKVASLSTSIRLLCLLNSHQVSQQQNAHPSN